ncbi:hypothetical protein EVU96_09435 [Bacillus infantis]|uniref:hypothetical protein n=1 Tax=Bacillus infantis TaxID=324767 RepID=UPI00101C8717|nr:hypothetical protein [Bacillus infantis]RYI30628.1 hypothetical protein EVU96_09435 [Bacillus infantis]
MIQQMYELDENNYIKEVYVGAVDEKGMVIDIDKQSFITSHPPIGLFKAKWNGERWVEGASQEEINELTKPQSNLPTTEERVNMLENMILLMLEGQ